MYTTHRDEPEHQAHHTMPEHDFKEYVKFTGALAAIFLGAFVHYLSFGFDGSQFLDSFMGVFFLVFASFKLIGLNEFAAGFQSYDIVAKRFPVYAYLYPFIQLLFAMLYLLIGATRGADVLVIVVSMVSAYGVIQALKSKRAFHCVCLGNVIKLPLSKISFVEDFVMAIMALTMLFVR